MWSDPSHLNGLKPNVQRGIGVIFGPEESRAFMKNENLKLIIRSHEGPDAEKINRKCPPSNPVSASTTT